MVERGKGPTESPCSEAKNALVTADWSGAEVAPDYMARSRCLCSESEACGTVRNKAREGAPMGEQNLPRFKAESAGGGIDTGQRLVGSFRYYMAIGL